MIDRELDTYITLKYGQSLINNYKSYTIPPLDLNITHNLAFIVYVYAVDKVKQQIPELEYLLDDLHWPYYCEHFDITRT